MADDNNFQNRIGNPNDRAAASGGQGADPLAELARLIGQNDPFSEFGRDPRAPAPAPQRPMPPPSEQPLVGQPYAEARNQAEPAVAYQVGQDLQAFTQEAQATGSYREAAYRDASQMSPVGDFYDEAEPAGRSRGFITVMAVIALAVIGTVGAFGYHFIFSGSGSSTPTPVIRANPDPTKVPPPVASGESSQGKLNYDRLGDSSQGQRVISREEAPVDAKDLNRPNVTRNTAPSSGPSNQWASAVSPNLPPNSSTSSVSALPSSAIGEPKKVRTVPIRPESMEANLAPSSLAPASASQPSANAPNARATTAAPSAPSFVPSSRQPAAPIQAAPPSANAPLSLNDDSSPALPRTAMTPPPAGQARQAPVQRPAPAPQAAPPAPTQIATAPKAGGFLVQVSSQKSEADAQTALRGLQSKFPNVLGGQPATIRRAELGERGVFFRAMLGPFASRDQATQLCGNLKAAGGDCIVQGN